MDHFWESVIEPLLSSLRPQVILQIGAGDGGLTRRLLDRSCEPPATLHVVDPNPRFDADTWQAEAGSRLVLHPHLSLNALPRIGRFELGLIDGDHNWYTVYHELLLIDRQSSAAAEPFPTLLLHETGWPYSRRDRYEDPSRIPEAFRHPSERLGVHPETPELVEVGLAPEHEHAIYEHDLKNGVLTAIEDFLKTSDAPLRFVNLPGFGGLGLLAPSELIARTPLLAELFEDPNGYLARRGILAALEQARILAQIGAQDSLARPASGPTVVATSEPQPEAHTEEVVRLEQALGEERSRRLTLNAGLEAERVRSERLREYLKRARGHIEALLDSRRWRIGSRAVDTYLRLRLKRRPDTAEEHLARLFREIEEWQSRQRPVSATPRPAIDSRFHRLLAEAVGRGADDDLLRTVGASDGTVLDSLAEAVADPDPPLVSIITPTHNRAELLTDAIGSVCEQSYQNWELLVCDDGSTDDTEVRVGRFAEPRIRYLKLEKAGAAAARNRGLEAARGELIAYLDSDNVWHPHFLERMVLELTRRPGRHAAFSSFVDLELDGERVKRYAFGGRNLDYASLGASGFDFETLCDKNFVDLNTFVHRRSLYEELGGFDEELPRHQDWDLVLKFTFLREPEFVDAVLALYRRNRDWKQISDLHRGTEWTRARIRERLDGYHRNGLPATRTPDTELPRVSILSWDISRNHFSKAYNLAEALSPDYEVELLGFRFFDEPIFPPYEGERPGFETVYLDGSDFPDFHRAMAEMVARIRGDVIYAVKPQLPSLGVALLANYHFGKPVVLEANDLETDVISPGRPKPGVLEEATRPDRVGATAERPAAGEGERASFDPADPRLVCPYGPLWARILDTLARDLPFVATHNRNLDRHFGGGSFQQRNLKDESHYDPERYDRAAVRRELGFSDRDYVILFGGLLRRHKGIFELIEFAEQQKSEGIRLLFVSSRQSSDEKRLRRDFGERVRILPPHGRNDMARINLAADLTVLWLDPDTEASHYQMPFKLTDALAMRLPVVANDISDLGRLGRAGYLRLVDYGDFAGLAETIGELRSRPEQTREMTARGRRLFMREFSYSAARTSFRLLSRQLGRGPVTLPQAERFARLFAAFWRRSAAGDAGDARLGELERTVAAGRNRDP